MAPNPRVAQAFHAMKNLGITADVVKPVLKNLVKVYENNWDFIEEENYRALLDAIFEKQEGQVEQPRKKNLDADAQIAELKKKCRNEETQVAETKKKRGNNQEDEEAEAHGVPDQPLKRLRKKYQENHIATSSGGSGPGLGMDSKHLQLQTVDNSRALLKPKDEPGDYSVPLEVSVAAINPDSSCERRPNCKLANMVDESSSKLELASTASGRVNIYMSCIPYGSPDFHVPSLDELLKRTEDQCLRSYMFLDPNFSVRHILNKLCECALELGTSSSKESQGKNCVTPTDDSSSKSIPVDVDEAVMKGPLTPKVSFQTQDAARVEGSGILCLRPASNGMGPSTHVAYDFTGNDCGVGKDDEQNGMENGNSHNMMVVEHLELIPLKTSSPIYVVNDISKALENVVIPLVNEVNNELPPAFRYIPGSIIFENANVSFSLAQMGHSCSTCIGDCVSSPCACTHAAGAVTYTIDGLVKEDFLESILMNIDSPKQCLSYCKDCPLERSKQEDAKEGCKGHLVRKFIKECWWKCGCNRQCGNRIVQCGIKRKLQVFMTANGKGWGLRTLEDLPKGTFVCEFAGEILTIKELHTRVSQSSNIEKHEFPVLLDASWSSSVLKDEEALCLDAVYYSNVARFINHRCFDANLVGIPVEVDIPQHHFYRFALFTTRKVDAFEELTRDYGIDFDDHGNIFKTFECLCESDFCRNLRRLTRSRSAKKRVLP